MYEDSASHDENSAQIYRLLEAQVVDSCTKNYSYHPRALAAPNMRSQVEVQLPTSKRLLWIAVTTVFWKWRQPFLFCFVPVRVGLHTNYFVILHLIAGNPTMVRIKLLYESSSLYITSRGWKRNIGVINVSSEFYWTNVTSSRMSM